MLQEAQARANSKFQAELASGFLRVDLVIPPPGYPDFFLSALQDLAYGPEEPILRAGFSVHGRRLQLGKVLG